MTDTSPNESSQSRSREGAVLSTLAEVSAAHDLPSMESRLEALTHWMMAALAPIERELRQVPAGSTEANIQAGSAHLLAAGGKRLRPLCVILAARLGQHDEAKVQQLAVAVELVHNATLLHDDVVDLGDARRGQPSVRALYGNAVSVFAGDWLLIDALRRVRAVGDADVFVHLLDVIEAMIHAEAQQLANRGQLILDERVWRKIAEGKTAALFRWGLVAGGKMAGLTPAQIDALDRFGLHLGTAFQAIDDVLDFDGDPEKTGKALFVDLREGKTTYPLLLAVRRDETLRARLEELAFGDEAHADRQAQQHEVLEALKRLGALEETRAFARDAGDSARQALEELPPSDARAALETVLAATIARNA
jgi:octaprenyl-diphosphate synthase